MVEIKDDRLTVPQTMTVAIKMKKPIIVHFYYAVLIQVALSAVFLIHIPVC